MTWYDTVVKNAGTLFAGARMPGNATGSRSVEVAAVSSIAGGGAPLPCSWLVARGVPGNAAGSGSVEAAAVSIAGGGAAPARGGGFVRATNLWRFGRGVWHVTHVFLPLLGWVQASPQAQSVSGKTEGMVDGWCWGWRGGVADYRGTKIEKREGENLACGQG